MQAFDYVAPQTVDEAVAILSENGSDARMLAGGSDIIAQLKEGRRQVRVLVDVKKIPEANELSFDSQTGLTIGAGVSCCDIYENEDVASNYPALVDSTALIGSIQIQGRATIGGNLCNASPAADTIPTLIVLGATAKIAGPAVRETSTWRTSARARAVRVGGRRVSGFRPFPAARSQLRSQISPVYSPKRNGYSRCQRRGVGGVKRRKERVRVRQDRRGRRGAHSSLPARSRGGPCGQRSGGSERSKRLPRLPGEPPDPLRICAVPSSSEFTWLAY